MIIEQSANTVLCECLIILPGNLKTQTPGTEMAFAHMPSGFYSGLCSDSPCQLRLLPQPRDQTAFHWAWINSSSRMHPTAQNTPTHP